MFYLFVSLLFGPRPSDGSSLGLVQNSSSAEHELSRRSPGPDPCDPRHCRLPACHCGNSIPGGLASAQTPHLVLLTFDDAVNDLNQDFYRRLFEGRKNPNGCPITATFFVSHEWTDYGQVQDLYSAGHEVASHTVTHSQPAGRTEDAWAREAVGQAELLVQYAAVQPSHVRGFRAPFLASGGDPLYRSLARYGLWYDSSLTSEHTDPPLWPYTMGRASPVACAIPPCPSDRHPGLWQVPLSHMLDLTGHHCPMLDGCRYEEDTESIQRMLTTNFLRFYTAATKPPFPMAYHAAWFRQRPHREEALHRFLDSILQLPDVYMVTVQAALEWMRAPRPLPGPQPALSCPAPPAPPCGPAGRRCEAGGRSFVTCAGVCPASYPWVP